MNIKPLSDHVLIETIKGEEKTFFLAWSTTPWNKIATPALAINPELTYVKVKQDDEKYILAKNTLKIFSSNFMCINMFITNADFIAAIPSATSIVL